MKVYKDKIRPNLVKYVFVTILFIFFVFPLIWIFLVSIQSNEIINSSGFKLIPNFEYSAYVNFFLSEESKLLKASLYSLAICCIATFFTMSITFSSLYMIKADDIELKWKNWLLITAISLFFLPSFIFLPIVDFAPSLLISNSDLQLIIYLVIVGFPISLIFSMVLISRNRTNLFRSCLLITRNRLFAYYEGIIKPNMLGFTLITGLVFSYQWAEFQVSGYITKYNSLKPFSVELVKANKQHGLEFTDFAAGAMISIIIWSLFLLCFFLLSRQIKYSKSH